MDLKRLFAMEDKTVILTGGSGGLGTPVTEGLLEMGATVAVADVRKPVHDLANHPRVLYIYCDLSSTESIRAMFRTVKERTGRIDVLINCATYGAGYGPSGQLDQLTDAGLVQRS